MKTKIFNLIILDKSGSMNTIANAAIGGVNETIGTIKATAKKHEDDQEHFFSLVAFCGCERKYIFENVPISDVRPITSDDYQPCCGTPLYDAIGLSVNRLATAMEKEDGALAQVTIITDGYENASKEYSGAAVKGLIERFKAKGWTFAFIGANQDVKEVAFNLSINNSIEFKTNETETRHMFGFLSACSSAWADKVSLLKRDSVCMEEAADKLNADFFVLPDDK